MKNLIKFDCNYADEFNVQAFTVLEETEVNKLFELVKLYFEMFPDKELFIGFGTNEVLEFDNYEHFRSRFTITELDDSEVRVFQKHFPQYRPENPVKFGTGSGIFGYDDFWDTILSYYDEATVTEDIFHRLKQLEPDFETWLEEMND
jgi:hypothetical protein